MPITAARARYDGDVYHFEFSPTGAVTAVAEVERNGRLDHERIERNETYTLQDGFVVKTEVEKGQVEWTVFSDQDKEGAWTELAEGRGAPDLSTLAAVVEAAPAGADWQIKLGGGDRHAFGFGPDGVVTSVYEVDARGRWDRETIERDESYVLVEGFVLKHERDDGADEWTLYRDGDGDGLWTEIAEGRGVIDFTGVTQAFSADLLAFT